MTWPNAYFRSLLRSYLSISLECPINDVIKELTYREMGCTRFMQSPCKGLAIKHISQSMVTSRYLIVNLLQNNLCKKQILFHILTFMQIWIFGMTKNHNSWFQFTLSSHTSDNTSNIFYYIFLLCKSPDSYVYLDC